MSPSEISRLLVNIANKIDMSERPSVAKVASEIRQILAVFPEIVVISDSSHGEFLPSREDRDSAQFQCPVTYRGSYGGKQFELEYTMSILVTNNTEANEDGEYVKTSAKVSHFGDTDNESVRVRLDGVDGSDSDVDTVIFSDAFEKANRDLSKKIESEIVDSDAVSEWINESADSAEYEDPYSYYGVRRNDF